MAGFSLGGGSGGQSQPLGDQIPTDSFFLYTSRPAEEITTYTKGFELWQQQSRQHQHQHQHHLYGAGLGMMLDDPAGDGGGGSAGSSRGAVRGRGGGTTSCQDCGNQAKKDCMHMRCRTCCKSRGFQCPTHVKSTWVPAAKRRERHHQQQQQQQSHVLIRGSSCTIGAAGSEQSKRPREIGSSSSLAFSRLPAPITIATTTSTTSGLEAAASFPPEVSSPAVFRCVRMSAIDEADDQYAYQTAVSIGGRVFRGVLYDHGLDASSSSAVAAAAAAAAVVATSATAAVATAAPSVLDPGSLYPTPLSAFVAGTQFFPQPRP